MIFMSKKNKNNRQNHSANNKQRPEFKIPEAAKKLAKMKFKKFKKQNMEDFDSKKELKKAYYSRMVDYLSGAIPVVIYHGHLDAVQETKNQIYNIIADIDFAKYLKKQIKKSKYEFENMDIFPYMIADMNNIIMQKLMNDPTSNPEMQDVAAAYQEISSLIMEKKLGKMKKAGINDALAFDVLSIIPTLDILDGNTNDKRANKNRSHLFFFYRRFTSVIYDHAKTEPVDFEKIADIIFAKDKKDYYLSRFITFSLLERKEKVSQFNEGQTKVFNDITEFCFKKMNGMTENNIRAILNDYVESRKKDEVAGKDANRRYYIGSLPEGEEYGRILAVVTSMIKDDELVKKYF